MHPPNVLLATVAILFASHVTSSVDPEDVLWRERLADVANIDRVKNTSQILNRFYAIGRTAIPYMRDCDEMFQTGHTESGLYIIRPENTRKLVVQCVMDGCNGWTVIQRNSFNTELTWSETWTTYKYGFGNLEADHWLGTEYISLIARQKWYKVRINLDAGNNHKYAEYDSFVLEDESQGYRLHLGSYDGNAGDPLTSSQTKNLHDNMRFSCKDRDFDRSTLTNCADVYGGGWWYDNCFDAQLNCKGGMNWGTLCKNCKKSVIMLKPIHMYCSRV
ncbi:fibrinogen-like protein 1-like protein [Paroedura picta]|uniref:fibrinogen-like protein 1-like protein n=1 Tax=Paroedura picta TaxID=143630 RepID=UPI004057C4B9